MLRSCVEERPAALWEVNELDRNLARQGLRSHRRRHLATPPDDAGLGRRRRRDGVNRALQRLSFLDFIGLYRAAAILCMDTLVHTCAWLAAWLLQQRNAKSPSMRTYLVEARLENYVAVWCCCRRHCE